MPKYLSLGVMLEEGLEFAVLERVVAGIAAAAREIGVVVAAGDTKVVRRGEGGGIYLNTSGIGVKNPTLRLGIDHIRAGDVVLVSGPVGDHGIAVMLAREQFGLRGDLRVRRGERAAADARARARAGPALHARPDARRTGDGDARDRAGERARRVLREANVPVRDSVRSVCEMLGYDPYFSRARAASWRLSPRTMRIVRSPRCARRAAGQKRPSSVQRARATRARRARDHHRRRARDRGTRGRSTAADLLSAADQAANSGALSI